MDPPLSSSRTCLTTFIAISVPGLCVSLGQGGGGGGLEGGPAGAKKIFPQHTYLEMASASR